MKFSSSVKNNISKVSRDIRKGAPGTMARAVNKGAGIVKRDAQSRAPTPRIGAALKVVSATDNNLEAKVGFKRGQKGKNIAWFGKFFETGTKAHDVEAKPGSSLAIPLRAGKEEYTTKKGKVKTRSLYYTSNGKKTSRKRITMKGPDGKSVRKLNPNLKFSYFQKVNVEGVKKDPFLIPAKEARKDECRMIIGDAQIKLIQQAARGVR